MSTGKISGQNWEFDGSTITVHIPMTWKRRGGRKVIIAPDGGGAWPLAKPRPDERLIRAFARAHRWERLIEDGTYRSAAEIAEAEGVTRFSEGIGPTAFPSLSRGQPRRGRRCRP